MSARIHHPPDPPSSATLAASCRLPHMTHAQPPATRIADLVPSHRHSARCWCHPTPSLSHYGVTVGSVAPGGRDKLQHPTMQPAPRSRRLTARAAGDDPVAAPWTCRLVMVGAASDEPSAAATHNLKFHDDLTLAEAESKRLEETAGSLRRRQRVGIKHSLADSMADDFIFAPPSSAPCRVHLTVCHCPTPGTSLCTKLLEMRLVKANKAEGPSRNRSSKGRPVGLTSDLGTAPAVEGPGSHPPGAASQGTPFAESVTRGAFALASGLVLAAAAGAREGVSVRERDDVFRYIAS